MITDSDKLEAIFRERDNLRAEIIETGKSIRRTIFALLTIAVAVFGVYWDTKFIPDDAARSKVIFALSQFELFLTALGISLWANQRVHSGYIAALEERINIIFNEKLNIWETEISMRFFFKPQNSFFWSALLLILFSFGLLVFLIVVAYKHINTIWYGILLTIELTAIIAVIIAVYSEQWRVTSFTRQQLGQTMSQPTQAGPHTQKAD